jgi:ribosomal protein S18 acetylase RimI-like enzyme
MPSTPTSPQEPAPLTATFHLAGKAEIGTLVELMRQFNAIDAYPFDAQITRAALERFIDDPALGRLWLIQAGEVAIGYLALTFGYSFEYHGRDAFIDELYLLPSYRGQGIGTRAIQFAIAACRELGVHALHLEVERHNAAARRLYRRAGFQDHARYLLTRWIEEEASA